MTRPISVAVVIAIALAIRPAAQTMPQKPAAPAQLPPSARDAAAPHAMGTAIIDGVLTAVGTGRPVRRARINISGGDPRVVRSTTTDDSGAFGFRDLPAGEFTISAARPGYLDSTYGQKRPGSGRPGTPVQLAAGQHLEHLTLQIARGGVITGLVVDELGDPAFGSTVRAMRYVMRTGERVLQPAGSAQSDDRGIYRITGLLPGDYIVTVSAPQVDGQVELKMQMEVTATEKMKAVVAAGGAVTDLQAMLDQMRSAADDAANDPASGYTTVYYPGGTLASGASAVPLDISEEETGVDLQLQVVPIARLTGVLTSPDGTLPPGAQVLLLDPLQSAAGLAPRSARPGPDGRFTFAGVPQGQYTLLARSSGGVVTMTGPAGAGGAGTIKMNATAPGNQYWAIADVSADGRTTAPIALNLQPGMTVSGKLVFEGSPAPADLTRFRLSLNPVGQGAAAELGGRIRPAGLDSEGRFTLVGVVPGRYRVALASAAPGEWSLKSAVVAGQDALDMPLDVKPGENVNGAVVTATTRTTDLSGIVQGPAGQPNTDYTIVVFASDSRYWLPLSRRIQATRPSTTGRFSFRDLPPGDYRLAAVSDVEPGQWFDRAFLRQLVGASIPVTLTEGERKTQDVRVAR